MELKALTEAVCKLATSTGAFIRNERQAFTTAHIEHKGSGKSDMVSYVDKTAEKQLVSGLSDLLPEAGYITEEGTETRRGERYNWIVDPLDGTTNFIHGLPCFSVSIALLDGDSLVLGVVYEVNFDECFSAWKGGGAWLNGNKISVSEAEAVADSLVAVGFPYHDKGYLTGYMQLVHRLQVESHGVRRLGSAAVDLIYVACGRLEAFVELGLNPWDVAGGAIIVEEAGGSVSDFKGGTDYLFGEQILATNGRTHSDFMRAVGKYF